MRDKSARKNNREQDRGGGQVSKDKEVELSVALQLSREERDQWKALAKSSTASLAISALILALVVTVWIITGV